MNIDTFSESIPVNIGIKSEVKKSSTHSIRGHHSRKFGKLNMCIKIGVPERLGYSYYSEMKYEFRRQEIRGGGRRCPSIFFFVLSPSTFLSFPLSLHCYPLDCGEGEGATPLNARRIRWLRRIPLDLESIHERESIISTYLSWLFFFFFSLSHKSLTVPMIFPLNS